MSDNAASFKAKSTIKAGDLEHRRKINFNMARYNASVPAGKQQFNHLMRAREKAKNLKWRAIENLDQSLLDFEKQITKRGAKVFWAETAEEALQEIGRICKEKRLQNFGEKQEHGHRRNSSE